MTAPHFRAAEAARARVVLTLRLAKHADAALPLSLLAVTDERSAMVAHHEACVLERDEALPAHLRELAAELGGGSRLRELYDLGDEAERKSTSEVHARCCDRVNSAGRCVAVSTPRKCRTCRRPYVGAHCKPCDARRSTARVKTLRDVVRALGGVERAREFARRYPPPAPAVQPETRRGDASDELFQ